MRGNRLQALGISLIVLLLPVAYSLTPVYAQSCSDSSKCDQIPADQLDQKKACLDDLINQCQQLYNKESQNENTLQSQLNIIDGQTQVTNLKIKDTQLNLAKLERDINNLSLHITQISVSVDSLSDLLIARIIQTYKYDQTVSSFNLLFSAKGFSDLLEKFKYVQIAQAYEKQKLYELQATKLSYDDQKQDKQNKQLEEERLNQQLAGYQKQLDSQKQSKDQLLRLTKNNETRYQALITQLKADADSIARAINNVGTVIGPVKKGEVIAQEGLTGCTSGPHLHFEIYQNAKVQKGAIVDKTTGVPVSSSSDANRIWTYLVNPHSYLDNNQIGPPMQGYPTSTHISTEFGQIYALGKHTGLDIYDDAFVGTPLLATFDGTSYSLSDSGCPGNNINGINFDHGPAKGLVIDSGIGLVALYWHLL